MNGSEAKAKALLEHHGWTVLRNGWPDFLCQTDVGFNIMKTVAVEVKSGNDTLSPEQRMVHAALMTAGIPVFTIRPDRFDNPDAKAKPLVRLSSQEYAQNALTDIGNAVHDANKQIQSLEKLLDEARERYEQVMFLFNSSEVYRIKEAKAGK